MPIMGIKIPKMGTISKAPVGRTSLSDALFSGTQQRVLGLTFGHLYSQGSVQADRRGQCLRHAGAGTTKTLVDRGGEMTSPFESLAGTNKPLKAKPPPLMPQRQTVQRVLT